MLGIQFISDADHLKLAEIIVFVYCCVCVVISLIQDVRLVDAPSGVTQEEGHTGFHHLPPAVLALTFLTTAIQPPLSLVGREVEFCVPTNKSLSTYWKNPTS